MTNGMVVKRGDSSDILKISIKGIEDHSEYIAEIAVLRLKNNAQVIEKFAISATSEGLQVFLTPAQTALLEVGEYLIVCEVIKKQEDGEVIFRRELSWPIKILPSLINN